MAGGYVLWGGAGTGAVAIEAALTLMGQSYELRDVPDAAALTAAAHDGVPMGQVPALRLPSGEIMTESSAILLRLTELHPEAGLAPPPEDPARSAFLRWMSFVAAAIYAHYWVKDDPLRLVDDPAQGQVVEARLNDRIAHCWGVMEAGLATEGPWLMGARLTVLDPYVAVVSRFRPRRRRFYEVAPRMGACVRRLDAEERLQGLWAERYPFAPGWDRM